MTQRRTSIVAAVKQPRVLLALVLLAAILGYLVTQVDRDVESLALAIAAAALALLIVVLLASAVGELQGVRNRLADEHQRLERIFMDAPIAIALIDAEGRWRSANPALCRMLGFREEELIGRQFAEFTHPEDIDENLANWGTIRDGHETHAEYEKRYLARDGGEVWAQVSISQVTQWDEGEGFLVAHIQDITDSKRAQLALAEEQRLLRAFLEATPDQIYFKDLAGRFLRVSNTQAEKLRFGSPEAAIGKTDFDAFSDEHAHKAFEDEQRIIRTGQPIFRVEEREIFLDGRQAWVSTTKLPLRDATGTIVGTFGVTIDITARKKAETALLDSEQRWRKLLANSQEIVMLVGGGGDFTYASPSVERWLGIAPGDLCGTQLKDWSHPDDRAAVAEAFQRACRSPTAAGTPVAVNHRVAHRDGSWHSLETTLVCLLDDPSIGGVLISSRDVTERALLEQERERLELERRVSQRLEAVGQLAAGIAHEINTPLQFVGDSVSFLQEAVDELLTLTNVYHDLMHTTRMIDKNERRRLATEAEEKADLEYLTERLPKAFDRTVEGISRVRSIVQAMRRFSHASNSDTAPSDLNEALDTTLAVCRNEYKYVADVELDLGELPLVTCNIGEINQVFLNLIINAAQAIGDKVAGTEERGTISVSTRLESGEAVIRITDDGPGIPPELQDRIYEPFFTTKQIGKGSGQGLALARTTIEQHSGALNCASEPGAGATFTIRLPVQTPAATLPRAA
jgi:two-component system, NtrC family, sensor kinase